MQTEFKRLKRRPFLVPLVLPIVLVVVLMGLAVWVFDARATTLVIIVPPAEPTVAEAMGSSGLSERAAERARHLAAFLMHVKPRRGVDVVYASEDGVAQKTAAPVASSMGLAVNVVSTAVWARLQNTVMHDHAGEVVLVVATPDRIKAYLAQLGMGEVAVDPTDNRSVFVVSHSRLGRNAMIRLSYD